MAHLRSHSNSKFWYVRFRDADTGKWREESTHLLKNDATQTRQAQRIADKKEKEIKQVGRVTGAFREWIGDFVISHYAQNATRRRAIHSWESLRLWLNAKKLRHPREIRYQHGAEFVAWREAQGAGRNTALAEIHFLSFVLNEAIRREYAERNVLSNLGIGKAPSKLKPEFSDEQITAARSAFATRAEWMQIACEIQLHTGCRISETSIAMTDVLFARDELVLTDSKRKPTHPKKRYTVPLVPELAARLRKIKAELTIPPLTREMVSRYNEVLKAATGGTSHSFRVTFITRCRDAGIEERDAMALVNHSSRDIHAIYARTDAARLRPARELVVFPPSPAR